MAMVFAVSPVKFFLGRKKNNAATTIAGVILMKAASNRLLKKKKERERLAATRIQRFVRDRKYNAMIARRKDLFRGVCIQAMYRTTARGRAARVIIAAGARYVARRRLRDTRRWVIGLQALARGWLGRRRAESRRVYSQRVGEERTLGLVRWAQLVRRRQEEELVSGARSEDLEDDFELHRTFTKYCRSGGRRMVLAKLTALCKDAGLVDKRFPAQRVEISFSKIKPKDQSHLSYASFLAALDDIAIQHPDVRRLADAAAAAALEETLVHVAPVTPVASIPSKASALGAVTRPGSRGGGAGAGSGISSSPRRIAAGVGYLSRPSSPPTKKSPLALPAGSHRAEGSTGTATTTASFAKEKVRGSSSDGAEAQAGTMVAVPVAAGGHPFRPEDWRLLVVLQKYVLVNSPAGEETYSELEREGRGATQRALASLESAAVIIQARVARGCSGRRRAREAWERRAIVRRDARLSWAASLLQARFRALAAKTRVSKMALKRYFRCLDGVTGAEYYFDPKTGKASWTKPKILGKFNIPNVVVVPSGEDIMVPMCHECTEEVATKICADCDEDILCGTCTDRLHRAGNYANHLCVEIEMCEECDFQVAVKHCKQCGDNFCASCFAYLHRKGRLRRHEVDTLVDMCHDCGDRAQAFRCLGCEAGGHLLLCKLCLEARHHGLQPHQLLDHSIETVGLRSTKVKRMKEEKALRARALWLKAESAAAGAMKKERRRLTAAIKVQSAWRGYLARKRRRRMMEEHLLWREQRRKDDIIRRTRAYKIALFCGKARLLKSDTNRELVLKQYPSWWWYTIIDIAKPTFGWHEGAKMVREQVFFAKKVKRKGHWRVYMARLRLGRALLLLNRAALRERQKEGLHVKAVEAYRDARSRGGVSAEQRDALQQLSRKTKREAKKQEEERQEAEAVVKRARDELEALIGPFRLRHAVRGALKRGMLMPFPVSIQRGRAAARLERGQNMREVLKWMTHGRRVRIEPKEPLPGMAAAVVAVPCPRDPPPPHALGPFRVLGVKDPRRKEAGERKDADTDADPAAAAAAAFLEMTALKGLEGKIGPLKASGSSESGDGPKTTSASLSSPVLVLDRQWLLADAPLCQAYAMPFLPFPQQMLVALTTGMKYNVLVQAAVKVAAVGAHLHRDRLKRWQAKFDDDSPVHAWLGRRAEGSEALSQSFMLRRRKLLDVEKGFEEERQMVSDAIDYVLSLWARLQEVADFAKSAAATGLSSKETTGNGEIGRLGREVVLQLFKKWMQSGDRTKVIIMHRSGKSANAPAIEVVQEVGYIKIDLDTPTPVLREFIRKFCGGWLNEHAKGDRFVMEDSTGGLVRRSREGAKFFATAMDMVQERVNKATRVTEAVIFVQDEMSRTDPDAEVELVAIPKEDLLDPEWTPSPDDEGTADGAQKDGSAGEVAETRDRGRRRDACEDSLDGRSSDDDYSGSAGSMGSHIEDHEEDPFASMERDMQARNEEEEKGMESGPRP